MIRTDAARPRRQIARHPDHAPLATATDFNALQIEPGFLDNRLYRFDNAGLQLRSGALGARRLRSVIVPASGRTFVILAIHAI